MAKKINTVDLLPQIYNTPANRQFLAATLDQLVQNPEVKQVEGYIGQRVGPGVNPDDNYIVEPTKERTDYQLDPCVVALKPETDTNQEVITYPGINHTIQLQGGLANNADRLYKSEYYAFDPFVDFDMLVNYHQYYWLPAGPAAVTVSATDVPTTNTYYVTRENGYYTFDKVSGKNPRVTLARGGSYKFIIDQTDREAVTFSVSESDTVPNSAFVIDHQNNPELVLQRGGTYYFNLNLTGNLYPFYIKTNNTIGFGDAYNNGVYRNGSTNGQVIFVVPDTAPGELYYVCATQEKMQGKITVIDAVPGQGPGFWIQTQPGVSGTLPEAHNISSREVLGVINNGTNTSEIVFDVPLLEAQEFYFDLNDVGYVDLLATSLTFNDLQNVSVASFLAAYPLGVDGITNLKGRTVVFTQNDPTKVWLIDYVDTLGVITISLSALRPLAISDKVTIGFGTEWSRTSWYITSLQLIEQIPLLTSTLDRLYYQDGVDPNMFGAFEIINQDLNSTIRIDDIIGHKDYTAPNGVKFTNGLKVTFQGAVEPSSFVGKDFFVQGVGSAIELLPTDRFVTPEKCITNVPIPYSTLPYDIGGYDGYLQAPIVPEYITSSRSSIDRNPWSRSNRWFHRDVLLATNFYNQKTNKRIDIAYLEQGKRPILQFRGGIKLFDFGTFGLDPINVIDFEETDALRNVNGQPAYVVDTYYLAENSKVVFAADLDPEVRRTIYNVHFVPSNVTTEHAYEGQMVIYLEPYYKCVVNDSTVCLNGQFPSDEFMASLSGNYDAAPFASTPYNAPSSSGLVYNHGVKGVTFFWDGMSWQFAQQMVKINQAPLFDLFNGDNVSLSDKTVYPSSTFRGSRLFGYAIAEGIKDSVLGFALKYLNITNLGDIVFNNDLYTQTFKYVSNDVAYDEQVSIGFVQQYYTRTDYITELGWQPAATPSLGRQQLSYVYDALPIRLNVVIDSLPEVQTIQIFINGEYIHPSRYDVLTVYGKSQIMWLDTWNIGSKVEVVIYSQSVDTEGFYQVPLCLSNNALNLNSDSFSLGALRNHYDTIAVTIPGFKGEINGSNNSRDLGNLVPYGLQILQQSSPLTFAGYFMRSQQYDIFSSLGFNTREYTQFKNQLLTTVTNSNITFMSASEILDACISEINLGKTDNDSFYWSDMLPAGGNLVRRTFDIVIESNGVFPTQQIFDFTSANFKGLLVYLTVATDQGSQATELLERGHDYIVSTAQPVITVLRKLKIGDTVTIDEYPNTAGNFVPNTPTKMGLYPKYRPQIYYDTSYVNPQWVIQGHDGSITVAFGDIRDQVLLEFEKRIYNNIKVDNNPIPLTASDVIPGFFRKTGYSKADITSIQEIDFLSWVGWNNLDYRAQDYDPNNPFTYNYSQCGARLDTEYQVNNVDEEPLPGAWRGINLYFYDTIDPSKTPWEMLGFSEMPCWWCDRYGPVPYTSDNLVLWTDLENGYVADPVAAYYNKKYARPGLTEVIPVNENGQLLSPLYSVVGQFNEYSYDKSWTVSDMGPVEAAWRTSSAYPFAVMRLLALTRPAEFFALFADRDRYKFDFELQQFLYDGRYRLGPNGVEVYGNGVSKASYINWIVDYNKQLGKDSTNDLTQSLKYLTVKLGYRVGGYTDYEYFNIYADRAIPGSTNASQLIPYENCSIELYKNQPTLEVVYSALTVEIVDNGYKVSGYDTIHPYFKAFVSQSTGILRTITSGGVTVQVPANYSPILATIPYSTVFINPEMVVDFILGYGLYLESLGMTFSSMENGTIMNWEQMAKEFLYFSGQGWAAGTIIALNPAGTYLTVTKPGLVADTIESLTPENMLLDQYRSVLSTRDIDIERIDNTLVITSLTGRTLSFARLRFVSYEDIVVLDNRTVFNDLIYNPVTGSRQARLMVKGWITTEWDGTVNAPGFLLNRKQTITEWKPNRKYTKGQIVLFKNNYWSALNIVNPKAKFEYSDWTISNYEKISQGLLSNSANMSDELANSYDVYSANLNTDQDLLSYGLIGFRPRKYMADLDLDSVSQVNLYQQIISSKGTLRSAELFSFAQLGKEAGSYDIHEIWAILASTYGANANRSFVEFRLNEAFLTSNPCTLEVVRSFQPSRANQKVLIADLWRTSSPVTTTDVFPVSTRDYAQTALPSAGYVDLNDVDITVFDINDTSSIASSLDKVGEGTLIWAAKSNSYDWNVYRCIGIGQQVLSVRDNLNGTSVVEFGGPHKLAVGDIIVIRLVNTSVDGVYRVLALNGIATVTIAYNFGSSSQTIIYCLGLCYQLESTRVAQASDVASLPFANSLTFDSKVWVDNNGYGLWEVLQKTQPFSYKQTLIAPAKQTNLEYGQTLAQLYNGLMSFVAAPGDNLGEGQVIAYYLEVDPNKTDERPYTYLTNLTPAVADTKGFGLSMSVGKQKWLAIGAPRSMQNTGYVTMHNVERFGRSFSPQQLIMPSSLEYRSSDPLEFGESVSVSFDELWMYVGAAGSNEVYAYTQIVVPFEQIKYIGDGILSTFNYDRSVLIDSNQPEQLLVLVSNQVMEYPYDYTLKNGSVIFTTPPNYDSIVNISRRDYVVLNSFIYKDIKPTGGSGSGFVVYVTANGGVYNVKTVNIGEQYKVGDSLTVTGDLLGGTSPQNDLTIFVSHVDKMGGIVTYTFRGEAVQFQNSYSLAPYLYTATNIYSFVLYEDEELLRPFIDYTFNGSTLTVTMNKIPVEGSTLAVATGSYWMLASVVKGNATNGARFGKSLTCTTTGRELIVGAPYDLNLATRQQGSVSVYDRTVYAYAVQTDGERTFGIPNYNGGPIQVSLNGQLLTSQALYVHGQYYLEGSVIVLADSVLTQVGDELLIDTSEIQFVQKIYSETTDTSLFGWSIDASSSNDEVFVGVPADTTNYDSAGSVRRFLNQSSAFGTTTSTAANPILTFGDTLLVNGVTVAIPFQPNNTIKGLVDTINQLDIPNVSAAATSDLVLVGDGRTKTFSIGSIYSSASSYRTVVYVGTKLLVIDQDYTYNNVSKTLTFVTAPGLAEKITVVSGRITISVKRVGTETVYNNIRYQQNQLAVLPGKGSSFENMAFQTLVAVQKITSPYPSTYAKFGYSVSIDNSSKNLVIGSPEGNAYAPTVFNEDKTFFDGHSTFFSDVFVGSGVVYTFDYLQSTNPSSLNPGQYVFGQQIYQQSLKYQDNFGAAVNYVNSSLMIGTPLRDYKTNNNVGEVFVYKNVNDQPSWQVIHLETPSVDSFAVNSVFMYDRLVGSWQQYFDCINPLQGKILGVATENIDYVGSVDPANYNVGTVHNIGDSWGADQVGHIWWDTDTVRFLNPNQNNLEYTSRQWGNVFPGSSVDVYQWVVSNVAPNAYTGTGTPLSTSSYVLVSRITEQGFAVVEYYFWVRGLNVIDRTAGKTLSTNTIAQYIADPRSSGIPFVALTGPSTVAMYNALDYISAADTILHVAFDQKPNDDCVHNEYQTVLTDDANSFVNDVTYRKLLDSFAGATVDGLIVPDPMLSPGEKYGVQFRPRQSMFVNRFNALRNYLTSANAIILRYPVCETKAMTLLFSQQLPPPAKEGTKTNWDESVPTIEILNYQDITSKPDGYKYLVLSNSDYQGLWTILVIDRTATETFNLVQIQSYYTPSYWSYANWYLIGFDPNTEILTEVPYYTALEELTIAEAPVGSVVKVLTNSRGKYELYKRSNDLTWTRVGLEDGTIQFSSTLWDYASAGLGYDASPYNLKYYDLEPLMETRNIMRCINEQIFVDEMKIYRNTLLLSTFEYIYSELGAPYWLLKTSLVNVDHRVRGLVPYPEFIPDNQTFVLDYINEVKPYHTVVKQFNLIYYGDDTVDGNDITDFDCPSTWDSIAVPAQFVSPMLLPYQHATTTTQSILGDTPDYADIWEVKPWKQWFDNRRMGVQQIRMIDQGTGYINPPQVTIEGDCIEACIAAAIVDFEGKVTSIEVLYAGTGYATTPTVVITGEGQNARAIAMLGNFVATNPVTESTFIGTKVRSVHTSIKYDRCEYESKVRTWEADEMYHNGDLVRFLNQVWVACNPFGPYVQSTQFDTGQWVLVPAGNNDDKQLPCGMTMPTLSGADRTMGYYQPTVNLPGLDPGLLMDGVSYPGVKVFGQPFDSYTFESFSSTPFAFGELINEPGSYDYGDLFSLNVIYKSSYADLYLGKRYADINVAGDNFISPIANHAPEELVLGASFDTLDIRVYTRPNGHNEEVQGHGFPERQIKQVYDANHLTVSFAGLVLYPTAVVVTNQTTGKDLTIGLDYTIDWEAQTVTPLNNVAYDDVVVVTVFAPGGGTQVYKESYSDESFVELLVDVPYQEITSIGWFVDGNPVDDYVYAEAPEDQTLISFSTPLTTQDLATLVIEAPSYLVDSTEVDYSWSTPVTQIINAVTGQTQYPLVYSTAFTNPVNLIVTVNGLRLKTAASMLYHAFTGESEFAVPTRFGGNVAAIPESDIVVYVDGVLQVQDQDYLLITDTVDQERYVQLLAINQQFEEVLIAVISDVDCFVVGDQLVFVTAPTAGDVIRVTTWNDNRQQEMYTAVFVGPVYDDIEITQGYSMTRYSPDAVDFGPGSFDCTYYVTEPFNRLYLGKVVAEPSRLWVTVNGKHIFYGSGFTTRVVRNYQGYNETVFDYAVLPDTSGSYNWSELTTEIVLPYTLQPSDVVMVTVYTDILNPNATAYRIFQDMRGLQTVHAITRDTTTTLVESMSMNDNTVIVKNVDALSVPNLRADEWGVLTVNGERIMYREWDQMTNSVSSLLRGTAGTAAAEHEAGSIVYNMSPATILPKFYQNYIVSDTTLSEGNRLVFKATNINLGSYPQSDVFETQVESYEATPYAYGTKIYEPGSYDYEGILKSLVRVYVAGVRQTQGWTLLDSSPVTIEFDWYPPKGVEVTILVVQANYWDIPEEDPK